MRGVRLMLLAALVTPGCLEGVRTDCRGVSWEDDEAKDRMVVVCGGNIAWADFDVYANEAISFRLNGGHTRDVVPNKPTAAGLGSQGRVANGDALEFCAKEPLASMVEVRHRASN